jgi:cbb3-type cytochrome oxidase subunit 3
MENWQMVLAGMVLCIIAGIVILYQKHRENQ